MNEAETRAELIDPKLKENGWDGKANPDVKIHREYIIAAGKIKATGGRKKPVIADYVLTYKGKKLAIVEAKADELPVGEGVAQALDGRTVQVRVPMDPNARVNFVAEMEELPVEASIASARVIINSRTGSIVLNQAVTLGPCAIAHGNLSISISSTPIISQPNPLSGGQTVVTEKASIDIKQEPGKLIQLPAAAQLADVVRALNSLGATPQDLLAILQAIKSAGALNAELEVI